MAYSSDDDMDISESESELEDYSVKAYKRLKDGYYRVKLSNSFLMCPFCHGEEELEYTYKDLLKHAYAKGESSRSRNMRKKGEHKALASFLKNYIAPNVCAGSSSKSSHQDRNEKFVWPWKGVMANLRVEMKNGKRVGESGNKVKDELKKKGLNPSKVIPLWNHRGHSGYALVEFVQDWTGFAEALMFEKHFESECHGRSNYSRDINLGNNLYGWVARDRDYYSKNIVGDHLRKADLKSLGEIEAEHERINQKLVASLTNTIEARGIQCTEMENKLKETSRFLSDLIKEKDLVIQKHNEERRKIQEREHEDMEKRLKDHAKIKQQLESRRVELEQHWQHLKQREAHNDSEWRRVAQERKMNELATLEQKKADEKMLKLAETQQRQKEELHKKIIDLEKKLDQKQALELEIERVKGAVQIIQHMGGEGDMENKKKLKDLEEELKDKIEELEMQEALSQTLVIKERKCNDELQEARKALINGLKDLPSRGRPVVGVKRMGVLDVKPFTAGTKRKYPEDEALEKAVELCSLWEDHLRDPSWHPFKVITEDGQSKELIDEGDEKLQGLKDDLGEEACQAVITALKELNQCNPSGRYPVPEIWNFQDDRKATLKEAAAFLIKKWKLARRK